MGFQILRHLRIWESLTGSKCECGWCVRCSEDCWGELGWGGWMGVWGVCLWKGSWGVRVGSESARRFCKHCALQCFVILT